MEKNKQAWYCYGNRTNSYLLINYGFCFPDNLYNSFKLEIKVCLDYSLYSSENQIKPLNYLYQWGEDIPGNKCQEIRLKMNSINWILISYFREIVRETFEFDDLPRNKIFLTKAINLKFEAKVIEFYKQLIEYLIKINEQETTLEDDLKILRSGILNSDSDN